MVLSCKLFLVALLIQTAVPIEVVRNAYHGIDNEEKLESFLQMVANDDREVVFPYKVSAQMQRAEYAFFPTTKLKYFNEGKEQLESFIKRHPESIEARYVRLLIQTSVPSLLGYSDQVTSDASFIKSNLKDADLPHDYKLKMLTHIDEQLLKHK